MLEGERPLSENRHSQSLTPHKTQIYPIFPFLFYHWNLKAAVYGCSTLVTKVV